MRAPVFDIQTLSTHDGPGFRTVVFLQGCPLHCTWCCNPEGQRATPQLRWRASRCRACLLCAAACPSGAVRVEERDGGRVPRFEREVCEACEGQPCVEACANEALDGVGRWREADELVGLLGRDVRLYRNSGGGVTFSGGEPLLHAAFVETVASALAASGISVAVETCGCWDWARAKGALEACSLIYFDLKTLDAERHLGFTGIALAPVLANLRLLAGSLGPRVVLSLPIIPGVSDEMAHADAVAAEAGRLDLGRARLLPYHRLALGKYEALGRAYPHADWDAPVERALVRRMARRLEEAGMQVTVED